MTTTNTYAVTATPERVLSVIRERVSRAGRVGFAMTDHSPTLLVGDINDGRFRLRRARGVLTAPRVLVMHGRVEAAPEGSRVSVHFAYHPLVKAARLAWLLFFLAVFALTLPAALQRTDVLIVPAMVLVIVALMLVPFALTARQDRRVLRAELEQILTSIGPPVIGSSPGIS